MTDERWQRVKALFQAAVDRPAGEREAFLASVVGDDPALREDIESLLASDAAGLTFLDRLPLAARSAVADASGFPSGSAFSTMVLPPNHLFGPYEIIGPLGAGAMGEVYRARDKKLNREIALKVLPPLLALNPDRVARFRREAHVLAALNHPNIAAIYDLEESDGIQALVLELVNGPTLADLVALGPLSLHESLAIARQIADALEAAHDKGIIHRDLKPANIIVQSGPRVKVLDFGLAKTADGQWGPPNLTATDHRPILGTAAYMSPEQARGKPVDKRTDIWAFGCVLYEMLTGRVAFSGDTVSDTIARILEHEPDWSALPSATPAPIRHVLLRCLSKDLKQRMRDIGDVRIEIDMTDEISSRPSDAVLRSARTASSIGWLPWLALAAFAAGVGLREVWRPGAVQNDPLAAARFTRITDWPGTEGGAEISPDGKFVAFLADKDDQFDVWVTQVGSGSFSNLTADVPPLQPSFATFRKLGFSGDGSVVWFGRDNGPSMAQMAVPLMGGTPRAFLDRNATAPSWSHDGKHVSYFKNEDGDPLFVTDSGGADARQILVETDIHSHNPMWSPDGHWIYLARGPDPSYAMDIWRIRPSGESLERLTEGVTAVNFVAPLDARTLLYIARAQDRSGPWLWALDVDRRTTRRINTGLGQYTSVSSSRDGRRLAATVSNPTYSLWSVPLLERVADDRDALPYPSPAGRALAPRFAGGSLFCLSASGSGDGLWRIQNGQAIELSKGGDGGLFEPPAPSPDGSRVVIVVTQAGKRRLMIVSADGRNSRTLAPSIEVLGAVGMGAVDWSPDGAWIVTGGRDEQGPGLFKINVDDGVPVRLVSGQAFNPIWSPAGDLIVYAGPFFTGQVPLLGVRPNGRPTPMPDVRARPGGYRFLPGGGAIVYLPFIPSLDFWHVDLATGEKRPLTRLSNQGALNTFDIRPDGKAIVFDRKRENSDIVLIERPI